MVNTTQIHSTYLVCKCIVNVQFRPVIIEPMTKGCSSLQSEDELLANKRTVSVMLLSPPWVSSLVMLSMSSWSVSESLCTSWQIFASYNGIGFCPRVPPILPNTTDFTVFNFNNSLSHSPEAFPNPIHNQWRIVPSKALLWSQLDCSID